MDRCDGNMRNFRKWRVFTKYILTLLDEFVDYSVFINHERSMASLVIIFLIWTCEFECWYLGSTICHCSYFLWVSTHSRWRQTVGLDGSTAWPHAAIPGHSLLHTSPLLLLPFSPHRSYYSSVPTDCIPTVSGRNSPAFLQ